MHLSCHHPLLERSGAERAALAWSTPTETSSQLRRGLPRGVWMCRDSSGQECRGSPSLLSAEAAVTARQRLATALLMP